jgi:8-amino-7-oxononanoate synthase
MYNDDFLNKKLQERISVNALRTLTVPPAKIDFCSNDYLGVVKNGLLQTSKLNLATGSTGSRLLAGNYALVEETETLIAAFHQSEAALIFNSGYDANLGVIASVPQRGDTIIYDALCHASIRDGIRLSFAQSFPFAHDDMDGLEKKLAQATGNVFVVTESVFSMDGDTCPLEEIVALCTTYNAHLILDEAHATGVIGERGEGLAQHLSLHHKIFCRIHTFGKACGCHGAVVLGSSQLRSYLINFARSFIYSTSLPPHGVSIIKASYALFPSLYAERRHLQQLISIFQSSETAYTKLVSHTPIQVVLVPGNEAVKKVALSLQQNGLDVRPILYPTVPKDKERLRIVLHAFNTEEELKGVVGMLSSAELSVP